MTPEEAKLETAHHVLYRFFDDERRLLYIGVSSTLGKRLDKHLRDKPWFTQVAHIAVEHHATRTTAMLAERRAIVAEKPLHNLAHSGQPGDPFVGAPRDAVHIEQLPARNERPAWPEVASLTTPPEFTLLIAERVNGYVSDHPGCSRREMYGSVAGRTGAIDAAIKYLIKTGYIADYPDERQSRLYPTGRRPQTPATAGPAVTTTTRESNT